MKLSMMLNYAGDAKAAADEVVQLEKAGVDAVWVAEAYSFDAISMMGYLAAKTQTMEIGSAIGRTRLTRRSEATRSGTTLEGPRNSRVGEGGVWRRGNNKNLPATPICRSVLLPCRETSLGHSQRWSATYRVRNSIGALAAPS